MRRIIERIEQISGSVILVRADRVGYRELAEVTCRGGVSLGQVIRIDGDMVSLQIFNGTRGVSTESEVHFLGRTMETPFSQSLLGRVSTGSGLPRDNGPEVLGSPVHICGPAVNPVKRMIPRKMIRTGIPMIDVFNSLVESQKVPIFSVAGEGYNRLLLRIALQAEVDTIVVGGMGLTFDEYLFFRESLEENGALTRSILYIHTAGDPVDECILVSDISLAVAENLALTGKRVLVLLSGL